MNDRHLTRIATILIGTFLALAGALAVGELADRVIARHSAPITGLLK